MDTELKQIEQILQKYFEGECSKKEEQLLINYFQSDSIHPNLEEYKMFFQGIGELSDRRNLEFEEQIMDHILEKGQEEKRKFRWHWQTVSGVAAALLIAILAINLDDSSPRWKDTYSDPNKAYAEAKVTLQFIAGQYQKGMTALQPVKLLDEASEPLQNGMSLVNKGFNEIRKVEQVNEKLKKQ